MKTLKPSGHKTKIEVLKRWTYKGLEFKAQKEYGFIYIVYTSQDGYGMYWSSEFCLNETEEGINEFAKSQGAM